jgi:hypothetical protein
VRRPVFIGDFSALVRRQRILDEDALAEGEELDSNILSQHCETFRVGSLRIRSAATDPIGFLRTVVMGMPCWSEAQSRSPEPSGPRLEPISIQVRARWRCFPSRLVTS